MRIRTVFPLLAFIASSFLATAGTAQVRLDRLEVVLWPEYDRPSVLVILNATLSPDTALPAIVPLPMPTAAGAPHAVAKLGPSGNLLVAQHSVEVHGDWSTIKILTDSASIRLEYYTPLAIADAQRRHRFYWPQGIAIDQLAYEILHPVGATNMSVTPPADGVVEADSLTFYRAELGPRPESEPFSISLAYAKQSPTLSAPAVQAAPPAPAAQAEAVTEGEDAGRPFDWLPLALIAVAAIVVMWLMFRRPAQPNLD